MNERKCLGLKIRSIRKSQKITQEKLSEMINISPRQMVKIEMGQAYPSLETLKNIAKALDTPIQTLFENDCYDKIENLKQKIFTKIDNLDEKMIRFLYIITSNLD